MDGNELKWQDWTVRLGFNYREGPVLYQLAFDDNGTKREVAYRLSLAEMVVPYRDPSFDHYRRTAYDIGEWGLGYMTTSLELGCDCLGEIVYVDATLPDSKASPTRCATRSVCTRSNAVMWKHVDHQTGAEVRRQRRMVISCHATVANYEYLVYWRLYQDGNIGHGIRAGSWSPPRSGGRAGTAVRNGGRRQYLCPVPPALPGGPIGPRRRRRRQRRDGGRLVGLPVSPDNPHGLAVVNKSRDRLRS